MKKLNYCSKRIFSACFVLLFAVLSTQIMSAMEVVRVTSSARSLGLNKPRTITLNWSVDTMGVVKGSITSAQVFFLVGGQVVETKNTLLMQTPIRDELVRFRESLRVPLSVSRAAASSNGTIEIVRYFLSEGFEASGTTTLRVSGGLGGPGTIDQVVLRFEDQKQYKLVKAGEKLRAFAELRLSGDVTRIRGFWEAAPLTASSLEEPRYQVVGSVNQVTRRRRTIVLKSPELPTQIIGNSIVRFRFLEPELNSESSVLGYAVRAEVNEGTAAQQGIMTALTPVDGSRLTTAINFSWQAISTAYSYRLEFYTLEKPYSIGDDESLLTSGNVGELVTGVMLLADKQSTKVSPATLAHLKSSHYYFWKVLALDENGKELSSSEVRLLRF